MQTRSPRRAGAGVGVASATVALGASLLFSACQPSKGYQRARGATSTVQPTTCVTDRTPLSSTTCQLTQAQFTKATEIKIPSQATGFVGQYEQFQEWHIGGAFTLPVNAVDDFVAANPRFGKLKIDGGPESVDGRVAGESITVTIVSQTDDLVTVNVSDFTT